MEMAITVLHQKLTNITIIVANNLQQICSQTSKMTTNTTLSSIKRAICALWLQPPLLEKWHQTDTKSTSKTLKRITNATFDFLVYLFNKAHLLWFQGSSSYLKPDYVQQKWNELNEEHKLTDTAGDIFTQFRSAGENFFAYLFHLSHDDQFRHRVYVTARYLIGALVLIICIRCFFVLLYFIFSSFFMFISSIVNACLQIVCSIFGFLFSIIFFTIKACLQIVCTIFGFLFFIIFFTIKACLEFVCTIFRFLRLVIISCLDPVRTIFWFLKRLLCFGGKSTVKMMKAPGRPSMMIARAAFEANPLGYFAKLRGRL